MSIKIRTIKAQITPGLKEFDFNNSIQFKGETLGKLKIEKRKTNVYKVKVYQDLNGDGDLTGDDLIFRGKLGSVAEVDDLTNFSGVIKIKKQMHSCTWDLQKNLERSIQPIVCTMEYVPEFTVMKLKSDISGNQYFPEPLDKSQGDLFF